MKSNGDKSISDVRPVTFMKTHAAKLLKEVKVSKRPIYITQNGEPQAVLQELGEYKKQQKLLLLLRLVALGEHEIKHDSFIAQDEVFARIETQIAGRSRKHG